jgi:hypothetical protein
LLLLLTAEAVQLPGVYLSTLSASLFTAKKTKKNSLTHVFLCAICYCIERKRSCLYQGISNTVGFRTNPYFKLSDEKNLLL